MSGFSAKATRFFQDLEDDNSREFWPANADIFEREVKQPMTALLESLPEKYQPFRLFRMNRDLRFTKDKSPYKTQQGAISEAEGSDYYLHLGRQRTAGRRRRVPDGAGPARALPGGGGRQPGRRSAGADPGRVAGRVGPAAPTGCRR